MLTINIRNDGTGTDDAANYAYTVMVNREVIASGEVKDHKRLDGWRALVRQVLRETNK